MKNCKVCEKPRPKGFTVTCGRAECEMASYYMNAASASRKGSGQRRYFESIAEQRVAGAICASNYAVKRFDTLIAARQCPFCNGKLLGPTKEGTVFCKVCTREYEVT